MDKTISFSYDAKTYIVNIKYKWVRCISARLIKDGSINVTAPYGTSNERIFSLVNKLLKSYNKKLSKSFKEELVGDDYIYLFGKKYPLIKSNKTKFLDEVFYYKDKNSIKNYLRKFSYQIFLELTRKYETIMKISKPYKVQVRFMKTKHGCNSIRNGLKRITYSIYLIHLDFDIIEFIVVHELCHEFHRDHQKGFHNLLNLILPDAKERNKKLRSYEHMLEKVKW